MRIPVRTSLVAAQQTEAARLARVTGIKTVDNQIEVDPALPDLARAAALQAEREAIQQALDQFRWNRRKTAQLLGVNYKSLLNKMKECGITAPPELDSQA